MRIKRATLRRTGDRYEMYCPSQHKERNTECVYGIDDNRLEIAGHIIKEHPKFDTLPKFENWCSKFFGDGNAWWENND